MHVISPHPTVEGGRTLQDVSSQEMELTSDLHAVVGLKKIKELNYKRLERKNTTTTTYFRKRIISS